MTRLHEQETLLGLKNFLLQQFYDTNGQAVPLGINRELSRVVEQRLQDIWAQSAEPQIVKLIEATVRKTMDTVQRDYHLLPKAEA